jgi:hypothetical protein
MLKAAFASVKNVWMNPTGLCRAFHHLQKKKKSLSLDF